MRNSLFWGPENESVHYLSGQTDRIKRAMEISLDSQYFDAESKCARIRDYAVSLEYCTCPDFEERQLPCKHMYRLAHELNVFDLFSHRYTSYLPKPKQALVEPRLQNKVTITPGQPAGAVNEHKLTTALLALFLGSFGAHKFYLRKPIWGLTYMAFWWTGIPCVVSIIESITYGTMSDARWKEKYSPGGSSYCCDLAPCTSEKWKCDESMRLTCKIVFYAILALFFTIGTIIRLAGN
jgi:TM2 domain-containing membrane protein YozV